MPTPSPATTKWVPLSPGGYGLPAPVVNGQWVKGVGGAAVWSAINYTDIAGTPAAYTLPTRLGATSSLLTDCNLAVDNGWYFCQPSYTANEPVNEYGQLEVINLNGPTNLRQIFYCYQSDYVYERRRQDGNWNPWQQMYPNPSHCATYGGNQQFGASQGWMAIYPTAYPSLTGQYLVEFGGMFTKPEAYDSQIGIHNGGGIVAAIHMPRNAGTYQHVHWKQNLYFAAGALIQFWAQYDGPSANPCTAYERYLKWTFNGPMAADNP